MSISEVINCTDCDCNIVNNVETLISAEKPRGCRRWQRRSVYVTDNEYILRTEVGCCDGTLEVGYIPGTNNCLEKYDF